MATNKNSNVSNHLSGEEDEDRSRTGDTGSGTSSIQFKDFITSGFDSNRDDKLSIDEKKRLLMVHNTNHEAKVKKLKTALALRDEVRQGKLSIAEYRHGKGFGNGNGLTKQHPLSQTAQFGSGAVDSKVNAVPDQMEANTNDELKQELQYQHRLENRLENRNDNRYTPKPSPFK